jgi:hypothetical protein
MLSGPFASGIGLVRTGKATSDGIRDAEALLRLDYVLVVRQRELSLTETNPPGHRIEGHFAGDALLFRLADGAFLDGFRVEATRNGPDRRYSPRYDLCRHARQEVLVKARALAIVMW